MLQAVVRPSAAKLDISRLLESSPSPQPQAAASDFRQEPQAAAAQAAAAQAAAAAAAARSASDPPPAREPPLDSLRSSVSSTHTGSDSYTALSTSSLPPHIHGGPSSTSSFPHNQQQSIHHHRPRIPSLSALPLPQPSLSQIDPPRHTSHPFPGPSLPEPSDYSLSQGSKRSALGEHVSAPPAKRQSKWTAEEDALVIELRGAGMKWEDISKRIPGRTPLSCRLHYQNYIERRSQWDEDRKNRLARLYERLKPEMWKPLAAELNVPWRAAEAMHWQLGQVEMARRAGVTPFSISSGSTTGPPGARNEGPLPDTSPTNVYPPPSPYIGMNYTASAYGQVRQTYLEERDQNYRMSTHGRPRSVSASSGDDRRGSIIGQSSIGRIVSASSTPSVRQASEGWHLPRLPEIEDTESAAAQDFAKRSPTHLKQAGPS